MKEVLIMNERREASQPQILWFRAVEVEERKDPINPTKVPRAPLLSLKIVPQKKEKKREKDFILSCYPMH